MDFGWDGGFAAMLVWYTDMYGYGLLLDSRGTMPAVAVAATEMAGAIDQGLIDSSDDRRLVLHRLHGPGRRG